MEGGWPYELSLAFLKLKLSELAMIRFYSSVNLKLFFTMDGKTDQVSKDIKIYKRKEDFF